MMFKIFYRNIRIKSKMVDDCHVEKILSDLGQPGRFQILFYAMSFVFMYLVGFNYATITALTGISAKHR